MTTNSLQCFFCDVFVSFLPLSSVTMDNPNVALLCLEQRDRSLETHTRSFFGVGLTHYPDRLLCAFTSQTQASGLRHASPGAVLGTISPHVWSGCWRIMDYTSPSAPLMRTSPAPHPNQRPASSQLSSFWHPFLREF